MAATSGFAVSSIRVSNACVLADRSSDCCSVRSVSNTLMSAPAMKVVPAQGIAPVISPFDAQAVEAALRIRDAAGEGKITILSDAARGLMVGGPVARPVVLSLVWAVAIAAVFAPLSVRALRRRV